MTKFKIVFYKDVETLEIQSEIMITDTWVRAFVTAWEKYGEDLIEVSLIFETGDEL